MVIFLSVVMHDINLDLLQEQRQVSLKERSQFGDAMQPFPVSAKSGREKEECVEGIAYHLDAISRNSSKNSKLFHFFLVYSTPHL